MVVRIRKRRLRQMKREACPQHDRLDPYGKYTTGVVDVELMEVFGSPQ